MAIEIVDFPIKNGGSFHGKMLVHQRVVLVLSYGFMLSIYSMLGIIYGEYMPLW